MRSLYRIDYKSNKKGVVQKGKTELVKVIDCNKGDSVNSIKLAN